MLSVMLLEIFRYAYLLSLIFTIVQAFDAWILKWHFERGEYVNQTAREMDQRILFKTIGWMKMSTVIACVGIVIDWLWI